MTFVGIIEENQEVVQEISQYFLRLEDYSLLFICSTLDEYRSLPSGKKSRAGIIISNPGESNFDRIWQAKYLKQVNREARILLLMDAVVNGETSDKIKRAGADSFIHKYSIAKDLVEFFGDDYNIHRPVAETSDVEVVKPAPANKELLTPREFEIIDLVVKGFTNKKIGESLFISPYTVNAHLRKIFIKLAVNSRTALINYFMNELI